MLSITNEWKVEAFRQELCGIDQNIKRTQGINLVGAEIDMEYSETLDARWEYTSPKRRNLSSHFFASIWSWITF